MRTAPIALLTAAALALAPPANAGTRAEAIAAARAEAGTLDSARDSWAAADAGCLVKLEALETVTQGLVGAHEAAEAIARDIVDFVDDTGLARFVDAAGLAVLDDLADKSNALFAVTDAMRAAVPPPLQRYRACKSVGAVVDEAAARSERTIIALEAGNRADVNAALETLVSIARAALAANDLDLAAALRDLIAPQAGNRAAALAAARADLAASALDLAAALEAFNAVKIFTDAANGATEEIIAAGVGADAPIEVTAAFDALVAIHDAMRAAALDHAHVAR